MANFNRDHPGRQPHARSAAQVSAEPDGGRRVRAGGATTSSGPRPARTAKKSASSTAPLRQGCGDHQPVLPEGQAALGRRPPEVRHLGRQARRRQAQQACRWSSTTSSSSAAATAAAAVAAASAYEADSGDDDGGSAPPPRVPAARPPQRGRPRRPPQPARRRAAVRRRTTVQGRRYSVLDVAMIIVVGPTCDEHVT